MIRRALRPEERSYPVYDGRILVGAASPNGGGYLALDRNGKRLGLFPSLSRACHAIRERAQTPSRGRR